MKIYCYGNGGGLYPHGGEYHYYILTGAMAGDTIDRIEFAGYEK